jgi:hypothetical protein
LNIERLYCNRLVVWGAFFIFFPFFNSYFKQIFAYIAEGGEDSQEKEERSYGSLMMERLTGSEDGRLDHMLQVRCLPI